MYRDVQRLNRRWAKTGRGADDDVNDQEKRVAVGSDENNAEIAETESTKRTAETSFKKLNPLQLFPQLPEDQPIVMMREKWMKFKKQARQAIVWNPAVFSTEELKLQTLMTRGGSSVATAVNDDWTGLTFEAALSKIDAYIRDNTSLVDDENEFMALKQEEDENFLQFAERVKAKADAFGYGEDQRMLVQIMSGARDSAVAKSLVATNPTYASLVMAGCRLEQIKKRSDAAKPNVIAPEVNAMKREREQEWKESKANDSKGFKGSRGDGQQIKDCQYCGLTHAKGFCPAFGRKCNGCGKMNHFEKVCRSKTDAELKKEKEAVGKVNLIKTHTTLDDDWID